MEEMRENDIEKAVRDLQQLWRKLGGALISAAARNDPSKLEVPLKEFIDALEKHSNLNHAEILNGLAQKSDDVRRLYEGVPDYIKDNIQQYFARQNNESAMIAWARLTNSQLPVAQTKSTEQAVIELSKVWGNLGNTLIAAASRDDPSKLDIPLKAFMDELTQHPQSNHLEILNGLALQSGDVSRLYKDAPEYIKENIQQYFARQNNESAMIAWALLTHSRLPMAQREQQASPPTITVTPERSPTASPAVTRARASSSASSPLLRRVIDAPRKLGENIRRRTLSRGEIPLPENKLRSILEKFDTLRNEMEKELQTMSMNEKNRQRLWMKFTDKAAEVFAMAEKTVIFSGEPSSSELMRTSRFLEALGLQSDVEKAFNPEFRDQAKFENIPEKKFPRLVALLKQNTHDNEHQRAKFVMESPGFHDLLKGNKNLAEQLAKEPELHHLIRETKLFETCFARASNFQQNLEKVMNEAEHKLLKEDVKHIFENPGSAFELMGRHKEHFQRHPEYILQVMTKNERDINFGLEKSGVLEGLPQERELRAILQEREQAVPKSPSRRSAKETDFWVNAINEIKDPSLKESWQRQYIEMNDSGNRPSLNQLRSLVGKVNAEHDQGKSAGKYENLAKALSEHRISDEIPKIPQPRSISSSAPSSGPSTPTSPRTPSNPRK